jgi:hypothetical protein
MIFGQEELTKPIAVINGVIETIKQSPTWGFHYKRFCRYHNTTFIHSINVALLTFLIAQEMGFQEKLNRLVERNLLEVDTREHDLCANTVCTPNPQRESCQGIEDHELKVSMTLRLTGSRILAIRCSWFLSENV